VTDHAALDAVPERPGCIARLTRILVVIVVIYGVLGIITTLVFVFLASGQIGSRAFGEPQTYIICLLWPVALWQYFLILLGLS
jgi:hypothetical protein